LIGIELANQGIDLDAARATICVSGDAP